MSELEPISRVVALARTRLVRNDLLGALARSGLVAGALAALAAILLKVLGGWWPELPEIRAVPVMVGASCLLLILVWSIIAAHHSMHRHGSALAVASLVDVQLGLHDRLSTAVAVSARTDPFARAAVEDGLKVAGDARVAQSISKVVPIRAPRRWWMGPLLGTGSLCIWWLLPVISFGKQASADGQAAAQLQAAREAARVELDILQAKIDESPELKAQLESAKPQERPSEHLTDEKLQSPDDVRRETTRAVNELSKRLDELLAGEKSQQLDALKDALGRIDPTKAGEAQRLAEALKRGDAASAKAALEELQSKVATQKLDEKTRAELAKQLEDLAKQLADSAKANDALKKALEGAGLDGALAGNSDAAKSAIENAKSLNAAQKEALRKALEAQKKANEQLERIASACKSMGSQCKNPGDKSGAGSSSSGQGGEGSQGTQPGEAAAMAADALSEMEMLSELLKDAQSARSQCQGGGSNPSSGTSGMNMTRGVGQGGEHTKEATATGTKARKEKVAVEGGDVIARQLVDAPPVVGPSRTTIEQLAGEIGKGYEEGTQDDPVPAALREVHKHYFGILKQKIDAKAAQPAQAPPAPSAKSAP